MPGKYLSRNHEKGFNAKPRNSQFIANSNIGSLDHNICLKENNMKILKFIWAAILDISEASYAAHLARNGQHNRAKSAYK